MNSPIKPRTAEAEIILAEKKNDLLSLLIILVSVAAFLIAVITVFSAILNNGIWDEPLTLAALEINGTLLTLAGTLWTALGVRMSSRERQAYGMLKNNSRKTTEQIVHSLHSASKFATNGIWLIILGTSLFGIKLYSENPDIIVFFKSLFV